MLWKIPGRIKVYEALGSIADNRIEVSGVRAKVYSSSRNKFYDVQYSSESNAITSNDNSAYWTKQLGYPAIAYLLATNIVSYDERIADLLKGIAWKDLNQQFKNDFQKTEEHILSEIKKQGCDTESIVREADGILAQLQKLQLQKLGETAKPPQGY